MYWRDYTMLAAMRRVRGAAIFAAPPGQRRIAQVFGADAGARPDSTPPPARCGPAASDRCFGRGAGGAPRLYLDETYVTEGERATGRSRRQRLHPAPQHRGSPCRRAWPRPRSLRAGRGLGGAACGIGQAPFTPSRGHRHRPSASARFVHVAARGTRCFGDQFGGRFHRHEGERLAQERLDVGRIGRRLRRAARPRGDFALGRTALAVMGGAASERVRRESLRAVW